MAAPRAPSEVEGGAANREAGFEGGGGSSADGQPWKPIGGRRGGRAGGWAGTGVKAARLGAARPGRRVPLSPGIVGNNFREKQ